MKDAAVMSIPFYESKLGYEYDYAVSFYNGGTSYPPHLHRCFEIILVLEKDIVVIIDSKEYHLLENDIILIKPYQIHEISAAAGSSRYLYLFSPELLPDVSDSFKRFELKNPVVHLEDNIQDLLVKEIKNANIITKKGILYLLCGCFYDNIDFSNKATPKKDRTVLHRIFEFIENNIDGSCTINSLSRALDRTPSYLSQLFSSNIGIPYGEYVRKIRINRACNYLLNTDDTVLDIAMRCGYNSLVSFSRSFKALTGENPADYRRKNAADIKKQGL